jgi:hypothetical protein
LPLERRKIEESTDMTEDGAFGFSTFALNIVLVPGLEQPFGRSTIVPLSIA